MANKFGSIHFLIFNLLIMSMISNASANSSDVTLYGQDKRTEYTQTVSGSNNGILDYSTYIYLFEPSAGAVSNPTVTPPSLAPINLTENVDPSGNARWAYSFNYANKPALDAAIPNGSYLWNVPTTSAPATTYTPTLTFSSDAYPVNSPTVANNTWTGGNLLLNPYVDNTITWNTNDGTSFYLTLAGSYGDFLSAGGAASTQSYFIPAGTLNGGETYSASLLFLNNVQTNTIDIPGVSGEANFVNMTFFNINAVPEPSPCLDLILCCVGLLLFKVCRSSLLKS